MTATPGRATTVIGRSGPSVRPVPVQHVIVLARNRPPSKTWRAVQSPTSRRARPRRASTASALAAGPASLCLCHGLDCPAAVRGRLLHPDDAQAGLPKASGIRRAIASLRAPADSSGLGPSVGLGGPRDWFARIAGMALDS
jgi:hypothetical protein